MLLILKLASLERPSGKCGERSMPHSGYKSGCAFARLSRGPFSAPGRPGRGAALSPHQELVLQGTGLGGSVYHPWSPEPPAFQPPGPGGLSDGTPAGSRIMLSHGTAAPEALQHQRGLVGFSSHMSSALSSAGVSPLALPLPTPVAGPAPRKLTHLVLLLPR